MEFRNFQNIFKAKRTEQFPNSFDTIYNLFEESYGDKNPEFFFENASSIVENLRGKAFSQLKENISNFHANIIMDDLLNDDFPHQSSFSSNDLRDFFQKEDNNIYELYKSTTQSNRSRAGKEFEAIVELILVGSKISFDSQAKMSQGNFEETGLTKLVDIVIPSVIHYKINSLDTAVISCKTTLRERWQETPEEMTRTGIKQMFLCTLDEKISTNDRKRIKESNMYLVTTKKIKNDYYPTDQAIITFEEMLDRFKQLLSNWTNSKLHDNDEEQIRDHFNQMSESIRVKSYPLISKYYLELAKKQS